MSVEAQARVVDASTNLFDENDSLQVGNIANGLDELANRVVIAEGQEGIESLFTSLSDFVDECEVEWDQVTLTDPSVGMEEISCEEVEGGYRYLYPAGTDHPNSLIKVCEFELTVDNTLYFKELVNRVHPDNVDSLYHLEFDGYPGLKKGDWVEDSPNHECIKRFIIEVLPKFAGEEVIQEEADWFCTSCGMRISQTPLELGCPQCDASEEDRD